MALPATHLRFAVDLAGGFSIRSRPQYLSGTLYPDSRCLTGVDRRSSHSRACSRSDFVTDDFTLGWYLHCRCDLIQTDLFTEQVPGLADLNEIDRWIQLSALKMLQDREDMREFDLDGALAQLTHAPSVFGEDPQHVRAYLDLVRKTYGGRKRLDMQDYHELWIGVRLDPELAAAIIAEARRQADDANLIDRLRSIYPLSIDRFNVDARR